MFIQTAFSFSNAVQRWVCRFSGLRLVALRWFVVFLASRAFAVSATSYHFESITPPQHPGCPTLQAGSAPIRIALRPCRHPQGPTIGLCFFRSFLHAYARGEPILRMTGVDGQHASAGFALP